MCQNPRAKLLVLTNESNLTTKSKKAKLETSATNVVSAIDVAVTLLGDTLEADRGLREERSSAIQSSQAPIKVVIE